MRSSSDSLWSLDDNLARLAFDGLQAEIDLLKPERGLQRLRLGDAAAPSFSPLGIALLPGGADAGGWADAYLRGDDLVATYASSPDQELRPQLYWRAARILEDRPSIELIVSMQTNRLDSRPQSQVKTLLPGGEVWRAAGGERWSWSREEPSEEFRHYQQASDAAIFLCRPANCSWSYAEMVHPTDFRSVQIAGGEQGPRWIFDLFGDPLEKGVIRRARVLGVFLRRENDQQSAIEAYKWLAESPPPLTT